MNYNNLDLSYFHQFTKGAGVKIAVLDSELYLEHQEFEGRDIEYMEFIPSTKQNYHGTATTSLIVGKNIGVAPEAKVYHLKILSDKFGSGVSWDRAFERAMALEVDIICMSIGTRSKLSPSMRQSLQRAKEKGIVILAPSGNEGLFLLRNPANDERVIAVGGKDSKGKHTENSNKHVDIEAYALSKDVLVADLDKDMQYVKRDGTSFANAIVAGQVALIIAYSRGKGYEIDSRDFLTYYNKNNLKKGKQLDMNIVKKELDAYLESLA